MTLIIFKKIKKELGNLFFFFEVYHYEFNRERERDDTKCFKSKFNKKEAIKNLNSRDTNRDKKCQYLCSNN